jgi:V/A-type H+-transporting ATPase subunit I
VAVVEMQKVRIYADKNARYAITDLLHEKGWIQIKDISEEVSPDIQEYFTKEHNELDLQIANIEFAIGFLSEYSGAKVKKRKITQSEYQKMINAYYYKDVVEKCLNIEEELVKHRNHLTHLTNEEATLKPWEKLSFTLKEEIDTEYTDGFIGSIEKTDFDKFKAERKELTKLTEMQIVNTDQVAVYFYIFSEKSVTEEVNSLLQKYKFTPADFLKRRGNPKEELDRIRRNRVKTKEKIDNLEKDARALTKETDNLSIIYDHLINLKDWKESRKKFLHTENVFVVEGWIPKKKFKSLESNLERITKAHIIQNIENPEEQPPVEIENNALFAPFESVTRIYGLPLANEVDPTPFLAIFFITFFGLCLTDAVYGLLLFALTGGALLFLDVPAGMKKLVRLLMFGGVATFILGILFGGYAGMDAAILPEWMTYTKMINGVETKMFIGQLVNPVKEPLIVLGLAFFIGYIQIVVGKMIDGWWKMKRGHLVDGLLDGWLWAYSLLALGGYAAVKMVPQLAPYASIGTYAFLLAVVLLVLTQGRKKSNLFGKITGGILSLYGFIGYVSDILSYSRLLALGLATGIIAMSVNLIANIIGGMIPVVGPIVMVVILIGGHIFNLALNALGSFIHSGRLQFVEFFGKFMEGGGAQFKPFKKEYKYTSIVDET